jgi:hypothetical protein
LVRSVQREVFLQAGEDPRIALECVHLARMADAAGRMQTEIADMPTRVDHDRTRARVSPQRAKDFPVVHSEQHQDLQVIGRVDSKHQPVGTAIGNVVLELTAGKHHGNARLAPETP